MTQSRTAPRPTIMRAGYDQPSIGAADCANSLECCQGAGCGNGMCGCCTGVVDDAVSCVLDCNGGCCDTCGPGGGCYGGMGGCNCGYSGRCGSCMRLRQMLAGGCQCGGAGQCQVCRCVRGIMASACQCGGNGQCPCCQQLKTCMAGPIFGGTDAIYNFNPGPSSAQVAYPYYTTRGPRDFFLNNPPSIGPY